MCLLSIYKNLIGIDFLVGLCPDCLKGLDDPHQLFIHIPCFRLRFSRFCAGNHRIPGVLYKFCCKKSGPDLFFHLLRGAGGMDLLGSASAEFAVLAVHIDCHKGVRYLFGPSHIQLLTDEKGFPGAGGRLTDQKIAGSAFFQNLI